jgi:hypothetical protein
MRILEAFSRFINALLGGSELESLSAKAYKSGKYAFLNKLFFWQNNHCRGAYNNGIKRMKEYLHQEGAL